MPGYSGTPLPKKLGIKAGFHVRLVDAPPDVRKELKSNLAGCELVADRKSALDFAMVFTKSSSHLSREFQKLSTQLAPAGMLWVSWPKKSSGVTYRPG